MNCERFEELLIGFIEDEIEPPERELVKKHLVTCPYCSKKLEEYKEIRRILNEETLPTPAPQVLASLSKIAREEVAKDKPPFWKRWFYSPILVPILSSALALFIWVYYGQKSIDYSPGETIYSREAMAKKVPMRQEPTLPGVREKTADKSSAGFEAKKEIPKQPTEEESLGRLEEPAEQEIREDEEKSKEAELYAYRESVYNEQLNLALKQQKEGNCEASIKTNEVLLKTSPPESVKEKAYLSLAECYEQRGEWGKAITNYKNLQDVAPKQTAFARDKIEGLRQKLNFLKARELKLGNTE